jgi:hypothetical protein
MQNRTPHDTTPTTPHRCRRVKSACLATAAFLLTSGLGIGNASAMSRMGDLEVRLQGDTPCFTITREERWWNGVPLVHSVNVYTHVRNAAPTLIWQLRLAPRTIRLNRDTCLPYGQAPAGAEAAEAPPLVPWQIYAVGMGGSTERSSDGTQGYTADFCLVPGEGGAMAVVNLPGGTIRQGQTMCDAGSARAGQK